MEFEKEFQKRIASELDLNTVISSYRERKSTRNKAQSFGGKAKDFSDQKRIDSQRGNSLSGDGWCWTKH